MMKLGFNGREIRKDIGVIEFKVVQNCDLGPVMQKF